MVNDCSSNEIKSKDGENELRCGEPYYVKQSIGRVSGIRNFRGVGETNYRYAQFCLVLGIDSKETSLHHFGNAKSEGHDGSFGN
eukprot:CAMPEP_0171308990 /NCGR_PEP_ID=MMETSP0816-20121228/19118_1 /TAXON_ID=420281 /ORGANISM="Proboscia inermis, Strain CCAP1064/1" /LENGTH=83 /DNA_ID=CAMNT_0011792233 /DNA_START=555 /DNA_END=806 /DNA_ORIENTATION=+